MLKGFFSILVILMLVQTEKNDLAGIWQVKDTSSQFEIKPDGAGFNVEIVPGSNSRYMRYHVTLNGTDVANVYKGTGFFAAKLNNAKECQFETEWQVAFSPPDMIIGTVTTVTPDPDTCEVKESSRVIIEMSRKK